MSCLTRCVDAATLSRNTPGDKLNDFGGLSPEAAATQVYTKWIPAAANTTLSADFQRFAADTVRAFRDFKSRIFFHSPTTSFHSVNEIIVEDSVFGSCFGHAESSNHVKASQSMAAFFHQTAMTVVNVPRRICSVLQSQGISVNMTSPELLCQHARDLWHGKQHQKMQRYAAPSNIEPEEPMDA